MQTPTKQISELLRMTYEELVGYLTPLSKRQIVGYLTELDIPTTKLPLTKLVKFAAGEINTTGVYERVALGNRIKNN